MAAVVTTALVVIAGGSLGTAVVLNDTLHKSEGDRKQAELHREQIDKKRRHREVRDRQAGDEYHDQRDILPAVAMDRRLNAGGNAEQQRHRQCRHRQQRADRQAVGQHTGHRHMHIAERQPEPSAHDLPDIGPELHVQRPVEPIFGSQLVGHLLVGRVVGQHHLHRIAGQRMDREKRHHDRHRQHRRQAEQAAQQEKDHWCARRAGITPRSRLTR